ncbi:Occluded RNA-recognition motif [Teratosphaeria destructans]|uniref:U4/U6 snRNA-associated-splicing factor PRP24 n=1 Tax=Teratosphaeria destructans TaxID=418781 RepID=A0A9W7SY45_9PEZI|nr:Occluded RNA-recognition motif [Teratosphaeria destructans]
MDINALLSPESSAGSLQERSPSSPNPPREATKTQRPKGARRITTGTSGLSREVHRSPDRTRPQFAPPPLPRNGSAGYPTNAPHAFSPQNIVQSAPGFRPLPTPHQMPPVPPTSYPTQTIHNAGYQSYPPNQQPLQRPAMTDRSSSSTSTTPQMQVLADVASKQVHRPTSRTNSGGSVRQADIDVQRSPSFGHQSQPPPPPIFRNRSGQSLADLTMAEGPSQTPPPRSFTSNSLSEAELQTVTDLLGYLRENSYAYDSHVQLINLLRKGFLAHVYPPSDADEIAQQDPHSYGLLNELRQAREAMDSRFAVGEDLWADWLADEVLIANSGEERVNVTELYQKAVSDEPASVKLWVAYADFVQVNHAACQDLEGSDQTGWTQEDKELCKELFTKEMLANVLEQAVAATQWRIDTSHLLWDRFADLAQQTFPSAPSSDDVRRLRDMFIQRLQIPHATSAQTAQLFWPIINKFEPNNWEMIMAQVSEMAEPARRQVTIREAHEVAVQRSEEAGDKAALFNAFNDYLQWDRKHRDRGAFAHELSRSLYDRALLRFPTYTEWWIDYIDLVISHSSAAAPLLPLIERATRHCPWSGDLWGKRILRSAVENKPYFEVEHTKHRATNSGLLDIGGLEELLKVLQQWCNYLRRHAFAITSSEDNQDTAEVGIVQALEDIQRAGETVYGKDFKGDPLYRLEAIQIKFLTEARRLNDAREIWRRLVAAQQKSYDFWHKYYQWEILLWGSDRLNDARRVETKENGPHLATAVVQEALSSKHIDLPEKAVELYLLHFEHHESAEKYQAALIEARNFNKRLAVRRAREAEAAAAEKVQQPAAVVETQLMAAPGGKRKAEDVITNAEGSKRPKSDTPQASSSGDVSASASAQMKRDREHNTVTMRNLPAEVTELDIQKFFRDISKPVSINILKGKDGATASATVEFESHEDVITAKTRNGKEIGGHEVRIHGGSQNTLYVTNYPAEYDEIAIRKLFEGYGEIISVRLPSLKYNNRRRFCYVQFLNEETARAAEAAMDGKMIDGQHELLAKVSNPDAKKQRSGAQAEGRELFVKNIDRNASEAEVTEYFGQCGKVASINLVKLVNGKRTGTAFIVFSNADEANAALAANNKPFKDRILHVELSTPKAEGRSAPMERARKTDVIVKGTTPEPDGTNGRRGSDVSMASAPHAHDQNFRTARERKIAIFNLPDTVNDARIRTAMEQYGPIIKIQLRYQEKGAIVEFANIKDAFNVRAGVDLSSLGAEVETGDVADLLGKKGKQQNHSNVGAGAGKLLGGPSGISRPSQRSGRRGGLGFKRGGLGFSGPTTTSSDGAGTSEPASGGKSNADFRAMVEAGKPAPSASKSSEDGS